MPEDGVSVKMTPMQLMPMNNVPFHVVAIDLLGPLSPLTDRRNRWIPTLVDCATRCPEAIPLSSSTTEVVAEALRSILTRAGFQTEVLNDNDPQFVSSVMSEVPRLMSIHAGRLVAARRPLSGSSHGEER